MNFIGRAIATAKLGRSSSSSHSPLKNLVVLYPIAVLQDSSLCSSSSSFSSSSSSTSYSTANTTTTKTRLKSSPKKPKTQEPPPPTETKSTVVVDWARPSEIPWQAKVANSVNLIGHVQIPVQFQASPQDGKYFAGTVIAQQPVEDAPNSSHSPHPPPFFWIPIIFEGDLAHIAACHLKKNDFVHISGQLSVDPPPFTLTEGQANVQCYEWNVIQVGSAASPGSTTNGLTGSFHFSRKAFNVVLNNRNTAPKLILAGTVGQSPSFGPQETALVSKVMVQSISYVQDSSSHKKTFAPCKKEELPINRPASVKDEISLDQSLKDLLAKPHEWWDVRLMKKGNSTAAAYEHKVNGKLVWIDESTPEWILKKLECLTFDHKLDQQFVRGASVKDEISVDQSLKDLLAKPHEWWDVRLMKKGNSTAAAYEHKVNDKLVWIDESTPEWILKKLECLTFDHKPDQQSVSSASMVKDGENSWRDLLKNSKQWCDHRENKLNGLVKANYPDFKHKETGAALWLNRAPQWVLPGLEGLEFDVPPKPKQLNVKKGIDEDPWKNLVENPGEWWDNRSNKFNARAPDFKHKDTGKGLWLSDSPAWALSKLPPLKADRNDTTA